MAHKARYTPPAKKQPKSPRPAPVAAAAPAAPQAVAVTAAPLKTARPTPADVPASVRYAQLPGELRWLGILVVSTVALLVILWLILK